VSEYESARWKRFEQRRSRYPDALFEHVMKTGVITPDAKSAILADAIERLKNADNKDMWIRGATEAVEGLRSDLAKIKL
jgi:hypothetical protein